MAARHFLRVAFWFVLYLSLVLAPLFVLIIGPAPPGRGLLWEFSAALGYSSLAVLAVQFALTARFRRASAPYGIDIIYYFHRQVSFAALLFIAAHIIIFLVKTPDYALRLLNPLSAPWQGLAATAGVAALGGLIATSVWRKRLGIPYERWRLWHGTLAIAAVALPLAHAKGVGYYMAVAWKQALWLLYAAFWLWLLAYIRIIKPIMMLKRPYTVEKVIKQRDRVWSLVLRPEGHGGLGFRAGQFAWLTIGKSPFAIEEHPFSFSSSAARPERLEFTIKERGDFTSTIRNVREGQPAYLDGPYGSFTLKNRESASGYFFIAGGIGIAPVMSMLRTLSSLGEKRPLVLVYGNKTWEKVTFREETAALEKRLNLKIVHVLESPPPGWTGETGYVTAEVLGRYLPGQRNSFEYFVCGPDPMMDKVERALYEHGVSIARFHSERFDIV
jgi:predicted ferric reductase